MRQVVSEGRQVVGLVPGKGKLKLVVKVGAHQVEEGTATVGVAIRVQGVASRVRGARRLLH